MNTPRRTPNRQRSPPIVISPYPTPQAPLTPMTPTDIMFNNTSFATIFDRPGTGSAPSRPPNGHHNSNPAVSSSEGSSNVVSQDSNTTRSWSPSPRRRLYDRFVESLTEPLDTLNHNDPPQPRNTSGNRRPESESNPML